MFTLVTQLFISPSVTHQFVHISNVYIIYVAHILVYISNPYINVYVTHRFVYIINPYINVTP